MKKTFEQFINDAKSVSLSASEKAALRERIFASVEADVGETAPLLISRNTLKWSMFLRMRVVVPIATMLFVLAGGTSAFAEFTLPGDFLYPLKTAINEEVRGWFNFSAEAKTDWQISLAHRRLTEIERLSEEGQLTPEIRDWAQERFETHALNAEKYLSSDFSGDEVADRASSARAKVAVEDSVTVSEAAPLAATLSNEIEITPMLFSSVPVVAPIYTEKEAVAKMKIAEDSLDELRELIKDEGDDSSNSTLRAKLALVRAERIYVAGKIRLSLDEYEVAYLLFDDVISVTGNMLLDFGFADPIPPVITDDNSVTDPFRGEDDLAPVEENEIEIWDNGESASDEEKDVTEDKKKEQKIEKSENTVREEEKNEVVDLEAVLETEIKLPL